MREKILVNALREKEYIDIKELQDILKVSDRTIRTEVKYINEQGNGYNFKITNTRGKGYKIVIEDEKKFFEYLEKMEETSLYGTYIQKDERVLKITKIILEANNFITIDMIAERLGYSRSTVISDLVEVYRNLEELGIEFEKKARFGTRIITEEAKVRKYLASNYYKKNSLLKKIEHENLFLKISETFIKELMKKDIKLSNIAIENIFYHFKILIFRVKSENYIEVKYTDVADERYPIFIEISKSILKLIEEEFMINIPEAEVLFVASQIYYKSELHQEEELDREKVEVDIKRFLEELDSYSKTRLSEDEALKENLLMHLSALINRVRKDAQIKNPYFEEINSKYPEVMLITLDFSKSFSEEWNLEIIEDELGFIAMHFVTHFEKIKNNKDKNDKKIGILCSSEGGLSILLKIKLEATLSEFNIDILNYRDNTSEYDLIVTNTKTNIENKKIIEIENIFEEEEIKKVIEEIKEHTKSKEEVIEEIFFKRIEYSSEINYIEFLKKEADMFLEKGLVGENFKEEVLWREESISTAYKNGIAAPHSIKMSGSKNVISVTVFKKPILWSGKMVDLVIFISLKKGSIDLHRKIGKIIFKITKDEELKNNILGAKGKGCIRELINL